MAAGTNRLEIAVVECGAAMLYRDYVINGIGRGDSSASPANAAERLFVEMEFPGRAPLGARVEGVARISGAPAVIFPLFLPPVLFAPAAAPSNESGTARITARVLRSERTHAALFFSTRGGVTLRQAESPLWIFVTDFPFSITYPGRRRSCA